MWMLYANDRNCAEKLLCEFDLALESCVAVGCESAPIGRFGSEVQLAYA